jgi:Lytic transglycolase
LIIESPPPFKAAAPPVKQPLARGEPYNPKDLTAASRNLPMGSTVKVTNPETGRSVNVRINDRGPFVHGRSLDLSKDAAEKIGITHKGVAFSQLATKTAMESLPICAPAVLKAKIDTVCGPLAAVVEFHLKGLRQWLRTGFPSM